MQLRLTTPVEEKNKRVTKNILDALNKAEFTEED